MANINQRSYITVMPATSIDAACGLYTHPYNIMSPTKLAAVNDIDDSDFAWYVGPEVPHFM